MTDTLIVIPARFASERFPGKVLAMLGGESILERVYRACKKAKAGKVIIATDSRKVMRECKNFKADAVMTNSKCKSGTDRVWQAAKKYPHKYIINVQADMPFIKPETIRNVCKKIKSNPKCDIATAYYDITDTAEVKSPNNVKIVLAENGRALYFSRAVIPYCENLKHGKTVFYKHYGIYAFKRKTLEKFVKLKNSTLENTEKLEQLRALEAGMNIYCIKVPCQGHTVDTPKDLKKAKSYFKKLN